MPVESESEIHLVPQGYVGPVFIFFDGSDGDGADARTYRIPVSGFLCFHGRPTRPTFPRREFYYEAEDGSLQPLPYESPGNVNQVHSLTVREIKELDGKPTSIHGLRYLVGVPDGAGWTLELGATYQDAARRAMDECSSQGE